MLTSRQLLAYLDRVEPALGKLTLYELLDIAPSADDEAVRTAFQTAAVRLHPDLYRNALSRADHDRLTTVYARIADAYLVLRKPETRTEYDRKLDATRPSSPPDGARPRVRRVSDSRTHGETPPPTQPRPPRAARRTATIPPEQEASVALLAPKTQRLYRRALAAVKTGDMTSAVLNLRMAVRSSPSSALLRRALRDLLSQLDGREPG